MWHGRRWTGGQTRWFRGIGWADQPEWLAAAVTATRLTYFGPPACASALAQSLEEQALVAEYAPPYETKDLATAMATASVIFSVTGSLPEIAGCVRAFTARFAGTRVDGLPTEETHTVQERLASVWRASTDCATKARSRPTSTVSSDVAS